MRPAVTHATFSTMLDRSRKRPRGSALLAKAIMGVATGRVVDFDKTSEGGKNPAAVALGRLGGLKGGKARAATLSKKRRAEIARRAAKARWSSDDN